MFRNYKTCWLSAILAVGSLFAFAGIVESSADHPLDAIYRAEANGVAEAADDLVILRRMSLVLRGMPPSVREIEQFEKSPREERLRNFAIFYLRDADTAHYWATKFGSALRERTKQRGVQTGSYFKYLSSSIHSNKPYNIMVRELLLAKGDSQKNPAANFYLRDEGDPLQIAEYVGRVFYGARLSCARCHDHPFNKDFTRRDYYGFAAFFSQVYVQKRFDYETVPRHRLEDFPTKERKEFEQKQKDWRRNVYNKMSKDQRKKYNDKHRLALATVGYEPTLALRFPHTDDQPGGDLVRPKFPDGSRALIDSGDDRREVFVDWLVDAENERFRKVLVNRVWSELMGWSFYFPLDDWNPDTEIKNEEVLDHLSKVFLKQNYRIKDLMLYIVTSDAFRRRAPRPGDADIQDAVRYFPVQRMNSTQLLNSMLRGSGIGQLRHIQERAAEIQLENSSMQVSLNGIGSLRVPKERARDIQNACEVPRPSNGNDFMSVFGAGARRDVDDDQNTPTIDQVLALLNGRVTGQLINQFRKKDNWHRKSYMQHKDFNRSIDQLYLGLLGRHMSKKEKALIVKMSTSKFSRKDQGYKWRLVQDVVWSIVNSQEFIHLY